MNKTFLLFMTVALFMTACSTPTPQTVEVTRMVTEIVTSEVTRLVVVTATPIPSTPTPLFARWTSQQAGDAIKAAGLEFESPTSMTKDDYGMAPMMAVEGIHFLIPSLCSDCGGRLLVFDNQAGLDATKSYYEEMGKSSALFFSWAFEKDNILLQINGDLPEVKAKAYQAALEALK
jgi:hypothetical protein